MPTRWRWTSRSFALALFGMWGLGADFIFHWQNTGSVFEFLLEGQESDSLLIRFLGLTAHTQFGLGFLAVILLPLFGGALKPRTFSFLFRGAKVLGASGLLFDFLFHWLDDGNPWQIVFDGFENPSPFVQFWALAAHLSFLGVFSVLIVLPSSSVLPAARASRGPIRLRAEWILAAAKLHVLVIRRDRMTDRIERAEARLRAIADSIRLLAAPET